MDNILKTALKQSTKAVDDAIDRLIPKSYELENQLFNAMRYGTLQGGKRLRPLLVLTACDLFGVDEECSLRVAASVEMVHAYSLIHDDLPAMDNAKLRRGRPSVHCEYDPATAILAGDGLQSLAFEILSHKETHQDPHIRCQLVHELARAIGPKGMAGGQMLDLIGETQDLEIGLITRLNRMKTGALIMFSCEAGAIMGKAGAQHKMAIRNYAHDIGLAFQLTDDLLDFEGVEQDTGKPSGQDATANKSTFIKVLGPQETRQKAELLVKQAISHLSIYDENRVQVLIALAEFILTRKS